jgi:ABC-type hemin transport system ATPase subunit
VLIDQGRVAAEGTPAEVVRRDLLEAVYRWPVRTTPHPGPGPDTGAPQVTPLARDARVFDSETNTPIQPEEKA